MHFPSTKEKGVLNKHCNSRFAYAPSIQLFDSAANNPSSINVTGFPKLPL
jgi:hypothetical protein